MLLILSHCTWESRLINSGTRAIYMLIRTVDEGKKNEKKKKKNLVIEKDEHCIHYFVPLLELCTNLNGCINIKKELIVEKKKASSRSKVDLNNDSTF